MVNMDTLKDEIVERLKPLDPEKIILFGPYAYGTPDEDSDIDLFLVKDINPSDAREYRLAARKQRRDLIFKHEIGFDVLAASNNFLQSRDDYFYRVDILKNGKILYAK